MVVKRLLLKEYEKYFLTLCSLLEQNYEINLPNVPNKAKLAENKIRELKQYILNDSAICIGYIEDDLLEGFLWAYKIPAKNGFTVHLAHLIVAVSYRGKGVGHNLFNLLDSIVSNWDGFLGYELLASSSNLNAIHFYESIGFSIQRVYMSKECNNAD